MTARQDKPVAVCPAGVGWIVVQVAGPDGVSHGCRTHRQTGMPGVCLLNTIRGQEPDGIDAYILKLPGFFHASLALMICNIVISRAGFVQQFNPPSGCEILLPDPPGGRYVRRRSPVVPG